MNQLQLLSFFPLTGFLSLASPPSLSWHNCTAGSFIFPRPLLPLILHQKISLIYLYFFQSFFVVYALPPLQSLCFSLSFSISPSSHLLLPSSLFSSFFHFSILKSLLRKKRGAFSSCFLFPICPSLPLYLLALQYISALSYLLTFLLHFPTGSSDSAEHYLFL